MNRNNHIATGPKTLDTYVADERFGNFSPTRDKLLVALQKSCAKSGFDPADITFQEWYRHEAWHDIGGLLLQCSDNARLRRWAHAWVEKCWNDPSHERCTDWNSYYKLSVEADDGEVGVSVMTSSYSIGD
jgi:hypothetical protein